MRLCDRRKKKTYSFFLFLFCPYSSQSFSYSSFYTYLHEPPIPNTLLLLLPSSSSFDSSIVLKDGESEDKKRDTNREREKKDRNEEGEYRDGEI
jgi:hypothetical protein